MSRSLLLGMALGCAGLFTAGCSTPGPPEITVYADGAATTVAPVAYCDPFLSDCESYPDAQVSMSVRQGLPVQISVPSAIGDTPWLINVQSVDATGDPLPVRQHVFTPGASLAFTAEPDGPNDRILVVEVQQLGAAHIADERGEPIRDESGELQLLARGLWTVDFADSE